MQTFVTAEIIVEVHAVRGELVHHCHGTSVAWSSTQKKKIRLPGIVSIPGITIEFIDIWEKIWLRWSLFSHTMVTSLGRTNILKTEKKDFKLLTDGAATIFQLP